MQVDVVAEVGHLPLEAGRIGQHPEPVLVEVRLSVDNLQHQLTARRVRKAPVDGRRPGIDGDNPYAGDGLPHLIERAAAPQNPGNDLQVGDCHVALRGVEVDVAPVAGEVEEAGREPLLVEPLGNELRPLDGQSDVAVTGRERHARTAVGGKRVLGIAARGDHIAAVEVAAAPLDGARDHLRPVGGPQRDARAGLGPQGAEPRRKEQPPGRKAPEKSLFHKLNYLIRFHYSLRGPVGPPHCSCLLQESGPDCRPKARQWHFPHRGCRRQPCPGEGTNGLPANKRGPRRAEPPFNREK